MDIPVRKILATGSLRLRDLRSKLGRLPLHQAVSPEIRRDIEITLLTERAKQASFIAIIGIVVASAIFLAFWSAKHEYFLSASFGSVILMYSILITHSVTWLTARDKRKKFPKFMFGFTIILVMLGSAWSLVLIDTLRLGTIEQRGMLYALAIGLISTTMITGPMRYAFSLWAPLVIGSFFGLLLYGPAHDASIMVAFFAYSAISCFSIITVNLKMFDREMRIIETKEANQAISLLLEDFQEGTGSFIWETNSAYEILHSRFYKQFNQLGLESINSDNFYDILAALQRPILENREHDEIGGVNTVITQMNLMQPFQDIVILVATKIGRRWWEISGKPIFGKADQFLGYRGVCSDITERESYKLRIEHSADRDHLTQIYNRAAFGRIFGDLCGNPPASGASILCLDLDRFKTVNDNYGHAVGDDILFAVTQRIRNCLRPTDYIFRLGGDEFAILLPDGGIRNATTIAKRVIEILSVPFSGPQRTIQIGVSIGISMIPTRIARPETVHREADVALYKSKKDGRGKFVIYSSILEEDITYKNDIDAEIEHALQRGQFSLVYQPIICLKTDEIISAEALLRWNHPRFGLIPPDEFISYLETTGQISDVGLFVIEEAVKTASQIPEHMHVAINLSSAQFSDAELSAKIQEILQRYNVDARKIEFEITESSLLQENDQRLQVLHDIKKLGVLISLDDFGTGYSSLKLLDQFQFDKLKIDASFLSGVSDDQRHRVILSSIINLGATLGLDIIGEGVETDAQRQHLIKLGCFAGQGFLFYRPMYKDDFLSLFSKAPRLKASLSTL